MNQIISSDKVIVGAKIVSLSQVESIRKVGGRSGRCPVNSERVLRCLKAHVACCTEVVPVLLRSTQRILAGLDAFRMAWPLSSFVLESWILGQGTMLHVAPAGQYFIGCCGWVWGSILLLDACLAFGTVLNVEP